MKRGLRAGVMSLPGQTLLVLIGACLYQKSLRAWMEGSGLRPGSLRTRHFLPFMAQPELELGPWLIPALVVVALYLRYALSRMETTPRTRLLSIAYLSFVAIGFSVAMIDGYRPTADGSQVPAFAWTYTWPYEYINDVPLVDEKGPSSFLLRQSTKPFFREQLHMRSLTHPPGPVLFLWGVSHVVGPGVVTAAVVTVLVSALIVIPVYWIGRLLHCETVARLGLALFLLTPNVILYTTTSMDGVYALLLASSLWCFLGAGAPHSRLWLWGLGLGISLSAAAFCTYSTVFLPLVFGVHVLVEWAIDRAVPVRRLTALAIAGATVVLAYLGLHLATGYDPISGLRLAWAHDTKLVGTGYESLGVYLQSCGVNLVAFLLGVGVPTVVLWAAETARYWRGGDPPRVRALGLAFLVSLLVLAFATLYSGETERIWMFMAPFVVVPAAAQIARRGEAQKTTLAWALVLLAVQVVTFEVTLRTNW